MTLEQSGHKSLPGLLNSQGTKVGTAAAAGLSYSSEITKALQQLLCTWRTPKGCMYAQHCCHRLSQGTNVGAAAAELLEKQRLK